MNILFGFKQYWEKQISLIGLGGRG